MTTAFRLSDTVRIKHGDHNGCIGKVTDLLWHGHNELSQVEVCVPLPDDRREFVWLQPHQVEHAGREKSDQDPYLTAAETLRVRGTRPADLRAGDAPSATAPDTGLPGCAPK